MSMSSSRRRPPRGRGCEAAARTARTPAGGDARAPAPPDPRHATRTSSRMPLSAETGASAGSWRAPRALAYAGGMVEVPARLRRATLLLLGPAVLGVTAIAGACDLPGARDDRPDRHAGLDGDDGDGDNGNEGEGEGEGEDGREGEGEDGREGEGEDGREGEGEPPPDGCIDDGVTATLASTQARFVEQIWPLMTRPGNAGCLACHADDSGRQLRMAPAGPDAAVATFLRLRAGGWLTLQPGSMVARVDNDSMPPLGTAWTADEKAALRRVACELAEADASAPAADEVFPAELELPWDGADNTDYDNAFITYDQLRGRIDVVFGDAWVRDGVDRFSDNIALFGGVDFVTTFVPARQATPEFIAGLDMLAEDVCGRAARDGTGPFAGLPLTGPIFDEPPSSTTRIEAENRAVVTYTNLPAGCQPGPNATEVVLCTTSSVSAPYAVAVAGDFVFRARVRPDPNTLGPPIMALRVDGAEVATFTVNGSGNQTFEQTVRIEAGNHTVAVAFTNDSVDATGDDRNLFVDHFELQGPLAGSTAGGAGALAATHDRLATLAARILQRPFLPAENDDDLDDRDGLYTVLRALDDETATGRVSAWAGVCEALLHHTDFVFSRPPLFDGMAAGDALRERLLVTQAALVLLDRTPTDDELARFDVGEVDRADLIEAWLHSDAFLRAYEKKVRLLLEFDGTPDGEEPARLWTYIADNDLPLREILTADYTVTVDGTGQLFRAQRPAVHGQTGLLTMKGYIHGKPGLPHYNYAARVLTGFLGVVFEVPQAALDARATATASSTVDPASLCYSCHRLLTPLAHQRLKWDDAGNHREVFDDGRVIDDSDRNLVADYPFRGAGLEAFSLVAVRKEAFARRIANAHFQLVFGRLLRHDADERDVYRALYDAIDQGRGSFRAVLRAVLLSSSVSEPPPLQRDAEGGGTP
jgi:hypothetical protein